MARVSDSTKCLLMCAYLVVIWNVYLGVDCVDEMCVCVVCGLIWCCYLSYGFGLLFDDIARIIYLFYIVGWLHPSLEDETSF